MFGIVPGMYADVSDIYFFPKWKRALVLAAGSFGQILLWVISTLVWQFSEPGTLLQLYSYIFIMCNGFAVFKNLFPFVGKTDGYHIFVDLIGIENLFVRSFQYVTSLVKHFFIPSVEVTEPDLSWEKKAFLVFYAISFFCFSASLLFVGGYLSLRMFHVVVYWASAIYFLSIMFWLSLAANATKMVSISLWTIYKETSAKGFVRFFSIRLVTPFVALLLLFVPINMNVAVPARVIPKTSTAIQSTIPGLIQTVNNRQGDFVKEGDVLITLSNPSLQESLQRAYWERERVVALGSAKYEEISTNTLIETIRLQTGDLELKRAQREYQQLREAHNQDLISTERLTQEEARLEHAAARYEVLLAERDVRLRRPSTFDHRIEASKQTLANLRIQQLEKEIEGLKIRAPRDGVILSGNLERLVGTHVKPDESLLRLGSRNVRLEAFIPEEESRDISPDSSVAFLSYTSP